MTVESKTSFDPCSKEATPMAAISGQGFDARCRYLGTGKNGRKRNASGFEQYQRYLRPRFEGLYRDAAVKHAGQAVTCRCPESIRKGVLTARDGKDGHGCQSAVFALRIVLRRCFENRKVREQKLSKIEVSTYGASVLLVVLYF
jgi:hypothetical protein